MADKHYHHGDLPRQLVEVTRRMVERDGPGAVTVARIARECGVSVAAPYRHFANKEALLGAVAAQGFAELRDVLAREVGGKVPPADGGVTRRGATDGGATDGDGADDGAADDEAAHDLAPDHAAPDHAAPDHAAPDHAAPDHAARERLVAAGASYVGFALAHPHLFRLMFSAHLRDPQPEAGPAALAALGDVVGQVELRVPLETAVRTTWALAHGLAVLRIDGMLTFTRDDSPSRLRDELQALLTGIAREPGA
ncbi:TetR/AcrR family transcriptional regulator [Myceligenerans pegani]|uniref:WHG domain-containing protein n=1 Tax=Myceligenerans pegani TaxID=2776917 RepID=A0ABR9N5D5_9MICO|nr:WHG domain-containing protein [Myceligenerans sp. TRM 65318]MBE1878334.1 WHG domain-containing protein [Myceligenerans sp. TRM 65318]MBE3020605.1 WHG domain-containing protein [Myceligenerans sp. TRM 65318]